MKYLIVGIGNIGSEYTNTRHNIGFSILDSFVNDSKYPFETNRYGYLSEYKFKGRKLLLLKPNTYVNLSGKAVSYWLKKENIPIENLMIIVDDLALPLGHLRIKPKGGDAGHNGLKNINEILGHKNYTRLRFGIGNDFFKGQQVDFVLGKWQEKEQEQVQTAIKTCHQIIKSFCTIGLQRTMNQFNKK